MFSQSLGDRYFFVQFSKSNEARSSGVCGPAFHRTAIPQPSEGSVCSGLSRASSERVSRKFFFKLN
jgi:hypothetical protein